MTDLLCHLCELGMQGVKSKLAKHLSHYALQQLLANADTLEEGNVSFETKIKALSVLLNPVFLR